MSDRESIARSLALVVGGAVMSALVGVLIGDDSSTHLVLAGIAITVVALSLGFRIDEPAVQKVRIWRRNTNLRRYRIGILADVDKGGPYDVGSIWTDCGIQEWDETIRRYRAVAQANLVVRRVSAESDFTAYRAILNPYGETYPEADFRKFTTYAKILDYVDGGGLFVNVAGVPTYYAYDVRLREDFDRTPYWIDCSGSPQRFFWRTPLIEELHLKVCNLEKMKANDWPVSFNPQFGSHPVPAKKLNATRAVVVKSHITPVVEARTIQGVSMTPVFLCKYGKGHFLISLPFLKRDSADNHSLLPLLSRFVVFMTDNRL